MVRTSDQRFRRQRLKVKFNVSVDISLSAIENDESGRAS